MNARITSEITPATTRISIGVGAYELSTANDAVPVACAASLEPETVSYTHLDVYKRQRIAGGFLPAALRAPCRLTSLN